MKGSQSKQTDEAADWVTQLQKPTKISELSPLAQRLIFSLRLIAVYRKAGKDPFAELASRLGSLVVAAKSLQLVEALAHAWPDPVQVRAKAAQSGTRGTRTASMGLSSGDLNRRKSRASCTPTLSSPSMTVFIIDRE